MSQVVDLTPDLLEAFLKQPIRQQDVDEWVFLGSGRKVADTLRTWALDSDVAKAYLDDTGVPVCLWGLYAEYMCWLIASRSGDQHARSIHRHWRNELAHLEAVATQPLIAITLGTGDEKWHKALGFEVVHREQIGNHVHHTVYKRRPPWEL